MKFSKTISIEQSHLHNIQEIMVADGITFAHASRKLIGLGLQKYMEANKERTTTTTPTTVISGKPDMENPEEFPPIETVPGDMWDKVGKQKEEIEE